MYCATKTLKAARDAFVFHLDLDKPACDRGLSRFVLWEVEVPKAKIAVFSFRSLPCVFGLSACVLQHGK